MSASRTETAESIDQLLGQVMGEVFDQLAAGETPDLDAYIEQYPPIADLLRQAFIVVALLWVPPIQSPVYG